MLTEAPFEIRDAVIKEQVLLILDPRCIGKINNRQVLLILSYSLDRSIVFVIRTMSNLFSLDRSIVHLAINRPRVFQFRQKKDTSIFSL